MLKKELKGNHKIIIQIKVKLEVTQKYKLFKIYKGQGGK